MAVDKNLLENNIKQFTQELFKIFPKEKIENIAKEVGLVKRKGKLEAWQILYLCAFSELDISKDTLVTMSANLSSKTKLQISSQAIDQRLNDKTVKFLKEIFTRLLKYNILTNSTISSAWDKHFKRIRIVDSTAFQVPLIYKDEFPGSGGNSQPAGVKIQLEYELKSGKFMHIDVGARKESDNTFGSKIKDTFRPGDLSLRDLGYFNFKDFEDLEIKKASYVSRLKPNIAVYLENENIEYYKNGKPRKTSLYKRIDLADRASQMSEGDILEIKDAFVGRIEKRKERLIIYKLTKDQLKERKEKMEKTAKKKGITKSDNTIKLLGITMYLTNIEDTILPKEKIHEIYSLRWQIEIIFKIWKSIFCISNTKPVKIERFKCQLYGKLILLIISSNIIFKMRSELLETESLEASEIKSAEIVNQHIQQIYICFMTEPSNVGIILVGVFNCIRKNGRKSHKKGKKTFFDILNVSYNNQERKDHSAA